jgi:hypothetical protein
MTMQLTPEQQDQVRQARAQGEVRAVVEFSAEQNNAWQQAVKQELGGKQENIAHFRKIKAVAEQSGFFGDIRRAILLSRRPIKELATTVGVEPRVLSDFRAADAELSPAELDRLVAALGLRLMQEIPR